MIAEMCLALALYHEARGEPRQGQMMVAAVIVNRVVSDRFPNDMCEVIMQPRQFSFVRKGKIPKPKDDKAWKVSHRLASQVLTDTRILPPTVADHYHTTKVNPAWRKDLNRVVRVGSHVFYSYEKPQGVVVSLRPRPRPEK